jgi:hypothetical protein
MRKKQVEEEISARMVERNACVARRSAYEVAARMFWMERVRGGYKRKGGKELKKSF